MFTKKRNRPGPPPLASYRTAGSATVDLHVTSRPDSGVAEVQAACTGCPDHTVAHTFSEDHGDDYRRAVRHAEGRMREWAQGHAEKCRAIPQS